MIVRFTSAWILLVAPTACFAAMQIQSYDTARHDRFGVNFIGAAVNTGLPSDLDFSGVGRSPSGRWGTLISPTHFLSANHFFPTGSLTFQDQVGNPATCDIVTGSAVGTTDIWVGTIDPGSCNLAGITPYRVAPIGIAPGTMVYQVGVTDASTMRVGRNLLSYVANETIPDLGSGVWANYLDDSIDGDQFGTPRATANNLNPDETYFVGGDSGGPSFIVDALGTMQLVGIHSYSGTTSDEDLNGTSDFGLDAHGQPIPMRRISGDAYLPPHLSEINATAIAIAVPEPSPVMCLAVLAGICLLWSTLGQL